MTLSQIDVGQPMALVAPPGFLKRLGDSLRRRGGTGARILYRTPCCAIAWGLVAITVSAASPSEFQPPARVAAAKSAAAASVPGNALAVTGARVVAAGQRGVIVHSDDGKTWNQAEVPVGSDLTALTFPSERQGWAVGHEGVVLHTSDGGTTWSKQLDGLKIAELLPDFVTQGIDKPLLDVWFGDDLKGYAVGAFGLILHTEDGGKTWQPWMDRVDGGGDMHLYAIRPAGGAVFVVGERGLVLKLDMQTQRFRRLELPYKGTLFGVVGTPRVVLAFGLRGNAFRSTDGGASWSKVETGVSAGISAGVARADGAIVLVTLAGQVLLSTDEGAVFRKVRAGLEVPAFAVAEAADGALAIAGFGGVRVEKVK